MWPWTAKPIRTAIERISAPHESTLPSRDRQSASYSELVSRGPTAHTGYSHGALDGAARCAAVGFKFSFEARIPDATAPRPTQDNTKYTTHIYKMPSYVGTQP